MTTAAQTRIMPIGDSITKGTGSTLGTGWRPILLDSLTSIGYECVFVGPEGNDPIRGHFYAGEGISSFYTGPGGTGKWDVAASMDLYQPHIVTVHLGSNDLGAAYEIGPYSADNGTTFDTQTIGGKLAQFISYLREWQNGTRGTFLKEIFVSAVIPRIDSDLTERRARGFFNTLWYNIYPDAQSGRIPSIPPNSFRFVNQYRQPPETTTDLFTTQTMMGPDGLHPNDAGYRHMANVFFASLRGLAMLYDKTAGDGQRVHSNEVLPQPLTVQLRNGYGTPLNNQPVQFQIVSGKAVFTDPQTLIQTGADGKASKSVRLTGEGVAVISATVYSTINRTLYFNVAAQDHIHIAGDVFYAVDDRPVPNVRIEWIESGTPIDTTGQTGQFVNSKIPLDTDFSVRPSKTRHEDVEGNAVLSYDAALVARHIVGVSRLDTDSQSAADVNKDGKVNLIDAIYIARYAVGYTPPAGIQTGEWGFTPDSQSFTTPGDTVRCAVFTGRIMGDVSGGWEYHGSPKAAWQAFTRSNIRNDSIVVTLTLEGGGFLSTDARILFDPSEIRLLDVEKSENLNDFQMLSRSAGEGQNRLGVYGTEEKDTPVSIRWIFKRDVSSLFSSIRIQNLYVNDAALPEHVLHLQSDSVHDLPDRPTLYANYPNPFNPGTTIPYTLPSGDRVRFVILNAAGQSVRTFEIGEMPAGPHEIIWDGLTQTGLSAPSGVYLVRLETARSNSVRKINLVR